MIDKLQNKMINSEDVKKKDGSVEGYFFPDYGITIEASSLEEAEEKLKVIINKK
jgi:hypothetical protein